ncbi:hypothetical protein COU36_01925 [Candidatus Micrarchaeota archaeon CG10_big_fil_rev_8_21_14_0_10_59_7]|nr:MAG: hypothetical protein COU36_01925 [Candidatus Micrarchaeota archaeon CG10_big_fil_rev_8_21_14_0_10_59_7]
MGRFAAFVMLAAFAFSVSAWCESTGDQAGLVAGCCTDQWGTKCDSCSTDLNGKPVVLKYYCANGAPSECFAFKVACELGKECSNGACTSIASATYVPTATAAPTYSAPTAAPTSQPTEYPMSASQPAATPMPAQPISTDTLMLGGVLVIALLAVIWFVARKPKKEHTRKR